ncbi:MAG TPA: type II toxin-antitoxin system VapC family toxin [Rubrivivax sp.]|nr:type II toxin-antitoxin system VapC family toxin [Rubrivivax sp.]
MITVDTSVLGGFVGDGSGAEAAEDALRVALSAGPVVACEAVLSEVVAGLGRSDIVMETLEAIGIGFSPLEQRAAVRAAERQRRCKKRLHRAAVPVPARRRVPDLLVGAHALPQCQALITRDAGLFRDYFKGLKVIVPQA